jgi:hypothetical protein
MKSFVTALTIAYASAQSFPGDPNCLEIDFEGEGETWIYWSTCDDVDSATAYSKEGNRFDKFQ